MVRFGRRPPWRDDFMLAGAWLALVPTALLFAGMLRAPWGPPGPQRRALRLAAGAEPLLRVPVLRAFLVAG
jgi:hypothetical protein